MNKPASGRVSKQVSGLATPGRRIGLLVDAAYSYGRGVTEGVVSHALTVDWRVTRHIVTLWSTDNKEPEMEVDGVIAMVYSQGFADRLNRWNVPVVNVATPMADQLPSVVTDNRGVGQVAARHFLERGFRHLAIVYAREPAFFRKRYEGFVDEARERADQIQEFFQALPGLQHGRTAEEIKAGVVELKRWLKCLPSPIGIYCVDDVSASTLINAAHDVGRHVPEEIAVLGTDNDELTVNACVPPLSSVQTPSFAIGVEAAKMLDGLMSGKREGLPLRVELPPSGIVVRASSELLAVNDVDLVVALRFIRDNVSAGIGVDDVLRVVPLSRRPLERKFRKQLGRTILGEIHRSRIERAKTLLVSTNLSVAAVAAKSGFQNTNHFGTVFRYVVGTSAMLYKNSCGGGTRQIALQR